MHPTALLLIDVNSDYAPQYSPSNNSVETPTSTDNHQIADHPQPPIVRALTNPVLGYIAHAFFLPSRHQTFSDFELFAVLNYFDR